MSKAFCGEHDAGRDCEELGEWFDRHAAGLVLYARQWVGRETAEDVVQEVFVKLAGQIRPPRNVRAWLLASVRNQAIDALKSGGRRRNRELKSAEGRWFEKRDEGQVEAGEIEAALTRLDGDEREVVILRVWAGATFEEIAEVAGSAVSTVHLRYQGALEKLRSHWEVPCRKT